MIKLILNIAMMMIAINAGILLETYASGTMFEFSLLYGLAAPVFCGAASWRIQQKIANEP